MGFIDCEQNWRSIAEKYVGRTESHEQLFLHATWEQQTKESMVVGGTSCYLECLVTSIACIT
jgi:tRNA A37 N6-isopentenylltransferase MiaA